MGVKRSLAGPCGLYCGVCGVYIAHRDGNVKLQERLSAVYGVEPGEIRCEGCLSDEVFVLCKVCPVKRCVEEKGLEGCHECDDFPCGTIENLPLDVGIRVMLRSVPVRRQLGTDRWMTEEEKRYRCPSCGYPLFRGVKRCRNCGESVDVD